MDSSDNIWRAGRDATIIEALNVALHMLVIHDGMQVRSGGNEWTLDFRSQIELVRRAMEMLGIDTSEPLIAPPGGPRKEDDDADV
ncbi:hypothetical protein VSR69_44330 [Paraburkholderia phytofirmans]|uniref:hypothetical protein n=1 Tax=Paraburkholderia sp. BL9I2N2 TaxID=1938809 RepID=UPI0010525E4F|nr:hypothetical protein [Paraburkholderia sp. BL9I2N2]TCK84160.1 hypothetical protein B0G74_8971 [Paraburkholderia sp. BL9I2N2]